MSTVRAYNRTSTATKTKPPLYIYENATEDRTKACGKELAGVIKRNSGLL